MARGEAEGRRNRGEQGQTERESRQGAEERVHLAVVGVLDVPAAIRVVSLQLQQGLAMGIIAAVSRDSPAAGAHGDRDRTD